MSGYDITRFVGLDPSLGQRLTCAICSGIYRKAVRIDCEHHFCDDCITQWFADNCGRKCPICVHLVRSPEIKVNKVVANYLNDIIGDLKVKCEFSRYGCPETIAVNKLGKHCGQCLENPQNRCLDCGLILSDHWNMNCVQLLKQELEKCQNLKTIQKLKVEEMIDDIVGRLMRLIE